MRSPALLYMALGLSACQSSAAPGAVRAAAAATQPPAEIHSAADKGFVAPAEAVQWQVDMEHAADLQMQLEDPGDKPGGMKRLNMEVEKPRHLEGRIRQRVRFTLTAEQPGAYVLPALSASFGPPGKLTQRLQSQPVYVRVSPEDDPAPASLRDLKPLEAFAVAGPPPWLLAAGAAALLALLAAAAWFWRRRRRQRRVPTTPALPAHVVALAALDRLQSQTPAVGQAMRQAAFAASEIVRVYVESRFDLHATFMTTEEIFSRLADLVDLLPEERRRLKEFLAQTDAMKYAGVVPDPPQLRAMFERARRFVRSTVAGAVPTPPAGPPPLPTSPAKTPRTAP